MIAVGHQPNYLPYLGLFAKAAQADVFVIVNNVQFVKRGAFGFQNRTRIRTREGWIWLTVPVLTKGKYHQQISETRINNAIPWRRKHWKSLLLNYQSTPHFRPHADFFEELYGREWELLQDLNTEIIRFLLSALGITAQVIVASEAGIAGQATELIVDICKKTHADTYLHGKHGADYADFARIEAAGIRNRILNYQHPAYAQCHPGFEPYMSAVDLLFNHGEKSLDILLEGNRIR